MTVILGTRLGAYETVALLGAGGMGDVYRAKDTKLGRDVALKILPPAFTSDLERLARFRREAKVIAALMHPHICTLYGVGHQDLTGYPVMEYLEGFHHALDSVGRRGPRWSVGVLHRVK